MKKLLFISLFFFMGHCGLFAMEASVAEMARLSICERGADEQHCVEAGNIIFHCFRCQKKMDSDTVIVGKNGYFFHLDCFDSDDFFECPVCKKLVWEYSDSGMVKSLGNVHKRCKRFL